MFYVVTVGHMGGGRVGVAWKMGVVGVYNPKLGSTYYYGRMYLGA